MSEEEVKYIEDYDWDYIKTHREKIRLAKKAQEAIIYEDYHCVIFRNPPDNRIFPFRKRIDINFKELPSYKISPFDKLFGAENMIMIGYLGNKSKESYLWLRKDNPVREDEISETVFERLMPYKEIPQEAKTRITKEVL